PGRSDVRVPALGHPPPRQLDGALIEGRLQLEQEQRVFNVQDAWHDTSTLASIWRLARFARRLDCNECVPIRQGGGASRLWSPPCFAPCPPPDAPPCSPCSAARRWRLRRGWACSLCRRCLAPRRPGRALSPPGPSPSCRQAGVRAGAWGTSPWEPPSTAAP